MDRPRDEQTPPPPPRQPVRADVHGRAVVLVATVMLSLALGLALSWAVQERRESRAAIEAARIARSDYGLLVARQNQFAELLSDPRTERLVLNGDGETRGHHAVILWNSPRQLGVFFGERLPPLPENSRYQLWARSGQGPPQPLGAFDASAGVTIHAIQPRASMSRPVSFFVTAEPPGGTDGPSGQTLLVQDRELP